MMLRNLTKHNDFVLAVKVELGVDSAEYEEFTQLMGAFQIRRTGVVHLISRMGEILRRHLVVLEQFKRIFKLADEYPSFQEAIKFINKVKKRFHADQRYATFLHLIKAYRTGNMGIVQIDREMKELFTDNPLQELLTYLPRVAEAGSSRP